MNSLLLCDNGIISPILHVRDGSSESPNCWYIATDSKGWNWI